MASTAVAVREDGWKIITELVLDGISSCHTRRAYSQALEEFLIWFRDEPGRQFNKATVQKYRTELETKGLAPSSINVRHMVGSGYRSLVTNSQVGLAGNQVGKATCDFAGSTTESVWHTLEGLIEGISVSIDESLQQLAGQSSPDTGLSHVWITTVRSEPGLGDATALISNARSLPSSKTAVGHIEGRMLDAYRRIREAVEARSESQAASRLDSGGPADALC